VSQPKPSSEAVAKTDPMVIAWIAATVAQVKPVTSRQAEPTLPARVSRLYRPGDPPHSPCASGRGLRERLRGALFLHNISPPQKLSRVPVCTRPPEHVRPRSARRTTVRAT
jgi:hypothetical protein